MTFKKFIIICVFFLLSAILFTFPLIINIDSMIYGGPGDVYGDVWNMWLHSHISKFEYPLHLFVPYAGAPYGIMRHSIQPVLDFCVFLFSDIFGEVIAYNILIILGFMLACLSMYCLVYYITKHHIASVFAGFIFGFSPYMVAHAMAGHIGFSIMNFLVPIYILFLLKMIRERGLKNFIVVGFLYAIVVLNNVYYGYFLVFFTFCFFCFDLIRSYRDKKPFVVEIWKWVVMSSIGLFSVLIFEWRLLFSSESKGTLGLVVRPFKEFFIFSAKPWDYVLPSVYNPFFGNLIKPITDKLLMGSNYAEQTLYLGILPIVLFIYVIIKIIKKKDVSIARKVIDYKKIVLLFGITALIMFIFSCPPFLPLSSFKIQNGEIISKFKLYFPSYFLYGFTTMFRVYSRFGFFVLICVCVVASLGFVNLYEGMETKRKKMVLSIAMFLIMAIEFASVPKFIDAKHTPSVYKWLSIQDGDFVVVEYPLEQDIHGLPGEYQFYQRTHKKRLFNGTVYGTYTDKLRLNMLNPFSNYSIKNLKEMDIRYIIIHKDKYEMNGRKLPEFNAKSNIKHIRSFDTTDVYLIN